MDNALGLPRRSRGKEDDRGVVEGNLLEFQGREGAIGVDTRVQKFIEIDAVEGEKEKAEKD